MKQFIHFNNTDQFVRSVKRSYSTFNSNQKNIIVIEPYGSAIPFVKRGVQNGFNIIILSANKDMRIVLASLIDEVKMAIQVDTSNENELRQLIQKLCEMMTVDAVIPGFEYFVPVALHLARYLGLPHAEANDVMTLRRKDLMRLTLAENNIPIPPFHIIRSLDELNAIMDKIKFPIVCKPIDSAGSVNVKKATTYEEAHIASSRILKGNDVLWGHRLSRTVLIEEYICGKEYSLEGIVQGKTIIHFSMTEKFVADQSEFVEIGHIVNPPIPAHLKAKVQHYVEQVIRALGINYCPFHAEIRLDDHEEPQLMEIASRLAGDKIGELIYLSTGIHYYDYVYAAYLNEDLPYPTIDETWCAGIRFFYRPDLNTYSFVKGVSEARQFPVEEIELYYQPHQPIPSFPKPLRRLGHVISKSEDYLFLSKLLKEIDQQILFYA